MSPTSFGLLIALGMIIGVVTIIALSWLGLRVREDRRLQRRLLGREAPTEEFEQAGAGAAMQSLARTGKTVEGWVDKQGETTRLLVQAGWRGADSRLWFYALQAAMPLIAGVLTVLLWTLGSGHIAGAMLPLYSFALFALSFLIPRWVLRSVAKSRQQQIAREIPLFIHLLVLLFEAGLSIRQAFASLVREGRGVLPQLGQEFELVLRQLEAGGETAQVLKSMGDGLAVEDLNGVLGVLRQIDKYGGEVREPLLDALAILEERRGLDMREKVNLVSGRMTVVMVLFFFPALLIFVAGPAALAIIRAMADVAGGK